MKEWLVIEKSCSRSLFATEEDHRKGYIPRDIAEKLLGRSMDGTVWFTLEESELMRAHPDWLDTEPPKSRRRES